MAYNDVFKEQLVARKQNSKDMLLKIGYIVAGIVLVMVSLAVPVLQQFGIAPFVAIGVIFGVVFLIRRLNIEYEYIFTNGELDIDKIFNKSKRKHAYSVNVRDFVVMVSLNHSNLNSELGNIDQTLDFSCGVVGEDSFAAVIEKEGKRIKILFDPNETLFDAIKMYIPRKIKK